MAIAAPSDEVIRLVEALGLRTKDTREVTLRMAVNEVVAVNTVEYVRGEQIDSLAVELKERQYRLARWISVEERLPEPDYMGNAVGVLACLPDGERCIAFCDNDEYGVRWQCNSTQKPTHWMPLPEPPEGK